MALTGIRFPLLEIRTLAVDVFFFFEMLNPLLKSDKSSFSYSYFERFYKYMYC